MKVTTSLWIFYIFVLQTVEHSFPFTFSTYTIRKTSLSPFIKCSRSTTLSLTEKRYFETNLKNEANNIKHDKSSTPDKLLQKLMKGVTTVMLTSTLMLNINTPLGTPQLAYAADGAAIAGCLFKKCQLPLLKCITNPKCLANVICINTCNGSADETGCQIKCGDIFENPVVGEFNKCAVSDMTCVPQKQDDGSYPVPSTDKLVKTFDTSLFNGRWYITAGQNTLFDIFPCQVHFFTETAPGKFFGKLNWRIEEPDGEFFTRDALQRFVQDPAVPAHLINHDNEFLHYEDDWYILDYEPDNNPKNVPPFALVYYRGSNDAWIGYGGAVVYTRAAKLPDELVPRLREAVKKVNFDFDKDFTITDNTCKSLDDSESLLLREKFAGKVAIQTEKQLLQQAIIARGNALNSVKAQKLLIENEMGQASSAFTLLQKSVEEFENELVNVEKTIENDIVKVEKTIENDIVKVEKTIEDDIVKVEKTIEDDIVKVEKSLVGVKAK